MAHRVPQSEYSKNKGMVIVRLAQEETATRFGVSIPIENLPGNLTWHEEQNVKTVLQYMDIAYSPEKNQGRKSILHLVAKDNTFEAPSTFPNVHSAEDYADAHAEIMASLTDLHIVRFDIVSPKDNFVSLRYTARGTHRGVAHNGIEATNQSAEWTAAANFVIEPESEKIKHWWKDWDKMRMWKQLGWVKPVDAEFV